MQSLKTYLLLALFNLPVLQGFALANNDIETIKNRVVAELMKPQADDSGIEDLMNTFKDDGIWPGIDY